MEYDEPKDRMDEDQSFLSEAMDRAIERGRERDMAEALARGTSQ